MFKSKAAFLPRLPMSASWMDYEKRIYEPDGSMRQSTRSKDDVRCPPGFIFKIKKATQSRIRDPLFAASKMVSYLSLFRIKIKIRNYFKSTEGRCQ